ncbi:hypothetical protein F5144DRAFT_589591 [Chaetomium tenue]|uniref:Uncharacterized protein n=1 Tax=Chaetomium tenue TaxID=1854479 RepID=A0ACB7PR77_9PEZI|nr:hypothetical protein F5144DRAFT_589591 [Chaetomium globosum]
MPPTQNTNNATSWYDNSPDDGAPPAYTAENTNNADVETNLTAAFDNLRLSIDPVNPEVDTCLAHLKLLFAFQWMKEDVGFTDGLWGLDDELAGPIDPILKKRPEKGAEKGAGNDTKTAQREPSVQEKMRSKNLETLSEIREKRWALFVARAVDRYEAWWQAMTKTTGANPLTEDAMTVPGSPSYSRFVANLSGTMHWDGGMLPPLDVLMVWHTHMLNPRAFLEDCMRAGMSAFWATGMPWHVVDKAIDAQFNYTVSDEYKRRWSRDTGRAWDNAEDPMFKRIDCPRCGTQAKVPWTTCVGKYRAGLDDRSGDGYGDAKFRYWCRVCDTFIRKELLAVAKFIGDYRALTGPKRRPMPGTLLDPMTGIPTLTPELAPGHKPKSALPALTFPNRLLKTWCPNGRFDISRLTDFVRFGNLGPTMHDARKAIEEVLKTEDNIKRIDEVTALGIYKLPSGSRIAIRKMMSRYWENFSIFALDLGGAVMRQGLFGEKMCKLDWLHSPSVHSTMSRLLTKYERFLTIMSKNPKCLTVPTLDVDLAWHTHQLSPISYYRHTVNLAARFIDHDDKIAEHTLSKQFEWTSKMYQTMYGEVYSECTCWYCEYPPSTSAHISAHCAVLPHPENPRSSVAYLTTRLADSHNRRLGIAYARACARAAKKGRPIPQRYGGGGGGGGGGDSKGNSKEKDDKKRNEGEVYYDHWGYPYMYAGPYAYPLWWTPGMYYGWYPGYVVACAAGSDAAVLMREGLASVEGVEAVVTAAVAEAVVVEVAVAIPRRIPAANGARLLRERDGRPTGSHRLQKPDEPERPWLAQLHSRGSREPQSLHQSFADITPESSVYIPTASLGVAIFESPNVSVNSSWESNLDKPFSIRRYLGNHERHEMILLSLSVASQRPVSPIPDALNTSLPSDKPRGAGEQSNALGLEKGTGPTPNEDPLHRYITDVQPHELLSLALEQKGHPPTQAQSTQQDTQKTESSISLSATLDAGERLEPDDDAALAAEVARRW